MLDAARDGCVDTPQPDGAKHLGCIRLQGARWAVLATHSQAEAWAEGNLRQRGYVPYVPRYAARMQDRVVPTMYHCVIRPLFPGYVFVQHDQRDPWRPMRYCPGVRANLLGGAGVQYARDGVVEALQAGEDARRRIADRSTEFRTGDAVRIAVGIFAGMVGCITAMEQHDMALVAVMFLGELREVLMHTDCIEARGDA